MVQSILRTALVASAVIFGATAAVAQFGFIFGDPPPRPPGQVPGGGPGTRPPPVQAPPQQYPPPPQYPQQGPPPGGGVQTKQLPPPVSAPPAQKKQVTVPPSPPPDDEIIATPAANKIVHPTAVFSGLDKITGRIINFPVEIGETVQFGALQLTTRACYTRPPTETANTDAFVEVDEVTLQGEVKRIFTGWMFASSPGLHAVEHPIYDLWLTDCRGGKQVVTAEAPPPEQAPRPQQKSQPKQTRPPIKKAPPPPQPPPVPPPPQQQPSNFPFFR